MVLMKHSLYRPYECTTKPMPQVFPMDMVEYADKDGILHNTIVTNVTFVLNGNTSIQGQGENKAMQPQIH